MLNGLIPVAIIYWAYEFLLDIPWLHQLLEFLGKYSATVFYIHTFIRTLWLRDFTYSLGHAAVIWLFLMGSSILIAVFLDVVKKLIHYEKISNVVIDGFIGWADRTLWWEYYYKCSIIRYFRNSAIWCCILFYNCERIELLKLFLNLFTDMAAVLIILELKIFVTF